MGPPTERNGEVARDLGVVPPTTAVGHRLVPVRGAVLPAAKAQELAPPTLSRTPTLPGLLAALARRRLLATCLGIPAAVGAVAVVWSFVSASKYTVRAMVHLSSVQETILTR